MSDLGIQHFSLGWGRKRTRKFNRFLAEQVTLLREMFDRRPKVKPDHAAGEFKKRFVGRRDLVLKAIQIKSYFSRLARQRGQQGYQDLVDTFVVAARSSEVDIQPAAGETATQGADAS